MSESPVLQFNRDPQDHEEPSTSTEQYPTASTSNSYPTENNGAPQQSAEAIRTSIEMAQLINVGDRLEVFRTASEVKAA